ncbi:MAG: energy-coupling factor ABC transporter permease [Giesbergeria sp.]|jgi:uncharacterized membrane protein|nr:energy-coupling factor ABC transporter permease [Giesbergeria sp.]
MLTELLIALLALAASLATRPWRLLASKPGADGQPHASPLLTPLLATLVFLPWLWALPALHAMPLQLQWSGACLVVLMLGWPLAMPVMLGVGATTGLMSPMDWQQCLATTVWQGVVPGTLALLVGALLRRLTGEQMFVYILGRAFLGTVLCVFTSAVLAQWLGSPLPGVDPQLSLVAHWLMAWGDAIVTGMLCAIFVAFRPQWLATWSDRLYLHR